jgi:hypothetical protein
LEHLTTPRAPSTPSALPSPGAISPYLVPPRGAAGGAAAAGGSALAAPARSGAAAAPGPAPFGADSGRPGRGASFLASGDPAGSESGLREVDVANVLIEAAQRAVSQSQRARRLLLQHAHPPLAHTPPPPPSAFGGLTPAPGSGPRTVPGPVPAGGFQAPLAAAPPDFSLPPPPPPPAPRPDALPPADSWRLRSLQGVRRALDNSLRSPPPPPPPPPPQS